MLRKNDAVANNEGSGKFVCSAVFFLTSWRFRVCLSVNRLVLVIGLVLFSHSVFSAVLGDMLRPYADYEVVFDDNMLRARNTDAMRNAFKSEFGTTKKFDIAQRITGGLLFEKEISRQRLTADGSWSYTFFDRFSRFNYNAQNVRGNWNWFLGKNLEGNMGATYARGLSQFLFLPGLKNFQTTNTQFFNADWRFHSNWGLHAGYQHFDLSNRTSVNLLNPGASFNFQDREDHIFDFGVNYYARGDNKVGVLFRHILGNFPNVGLNNGNYDQNEVRAVIDWTVFGKSWVQFTGGWVQRTVPRDSRLNFSGFNARMLYILQATDKIRLALGAWRETNPINSVQALFSLNTGVSFTPTWNITEKIRLEGEVLYDNRKFNGLGGSNNNNVFNGSAGFVYMPYHGLQISAKAFHNQLTSDTALGDVRANGIGIGIRYTYKDYDNKRFANSRLF